MNINYIMRKIEVYLQNTENEVFINHMCFESGQRQTGRLVFE